MHLFERELKRVVTFCSGLGLKVQFIDGKGKDYWGAYTHPKKFEPGVIEVVRAKSVTFQIITLLHEIGHHIDFTETKWIPEAYNYMDEDNPPLWVRQAVFNCEERAVTHGEKIYWTLMLRVPFWKVKRELDVDLFVYKTWLKTSDYPTFKEQDAFRRTWEKKFKKALLHAGAWKIPDNS